MVGSAVIPRTPRLRSASLPRAQKPVDELRSVGAVIPAVAKLPQRAVTTLEIRPTDVKSTQTVLEMTPRHAVLDPGLAFQQQIQRPIGLVVLDLAEP